MPKELIVKAAWDDDAQVWVATCDELPGLVVEASSNDELEAELKTLIPVFSRELHHSATPKEIPVSLYQESSFLAYA